MVTIPYWLLRYALPTAFLVLTTVAILLVRVTLHGEERSPVARPAAPAPISSPRPARTKSVRASAYSVRSGDTLGTIAERFGTTVEALLVLNPGIDPRTLRVGQSLRVK